MSWNAVAKFTTVNQKKAKLLIYEHKAYFATFPDLDILQFLLFRNNRTVSMKLFGISSTLDTKPELFLALSLFFFFFFKLLPLLNTSASVHVCRTRWQPCCFNKLSSPLSHFLIITSCVRRAKHRCTLDEHTHTHTTFPTTTTTCQGCWSPGRMSAVSISSGQTPGSL